MNVEGNLTSGQQVRLAGAAGSAFNLTGSANAPAIMFVLGPVNLTSGSLIPITSFYIGYPNPGTINGTPYTTGTLTISVPALNGRTRLPSFRPGRVRAKLGRFTKLPARSTPGAELFSA